MTYTEAIKNITSILEDLISGKSPVHSELFKQISSEDGVTSKLIDAFHKFEKEYSELRENQRQLHTLLARQTNKTTKLSRQLSYIFENTIDAIAFFELKNDGQIIFTMCNNKWANALELDAKKIVGMNIDEVCDTETTALYRKYINWTISKNESIDDVALWKNRTLHIIAIPIKEENKPLRNFGAFVTDFTEKNQTLEKMRNMEKEMTYSEIKTEALERRKLAADLHDNVGPLLSSMNMYLSSLSRKPEVQPYSETIDNIRRILKETISSVREISNNISPQVLNNYGLLAALNLFFETKTNLIEIKIDSNLGDLRFSKTKETMLYNIIKEAFNNTIKYAKASFIDIKINIKENLITLIYRDNGVGFNLENQLSTAYKSLGLFSIINRIKTMDGIYEIKTSPGNGFVLEVNFLTDTYTDE